MRNPLKDVLINATLAIAGRNKGIKKAVDHAEEVEENWSEQAYDFLVRFVADQGTNLFMTEDVRLASLGTVPEPPSKRAWGGIMRKASNADLITSKGYRATSNPKAHRTPATVWSSYDLPF